MENNFPASALKMSRFRKMDKYERCSIIAKSGQLSCDNVQEILKSGKKGGGSKYLTTILSAFEIKANDKNMNNMHLWIERNVNDLMLALNRKEDHSLPDTQSETSVEQGATPKLFNDTKMVPVNCPLCCDQPFETQQALFFHLRGLKNNLYCPICSDRFSSLEVLVGHLSRTCPGSLSPEAKKKSMSNNSINDESQEPISEKKPKTKELTDKSSKEDKPLASKSSCPELEVVSTQPASLIPPEIITRLSKNLTVSVEPVGKDPKKKQCQTRKCSSALNNLTSLPNNTEPCTAKSITSETAYNRISSNSSLDITLGAPRKTNEKSTEKPSLSIVPTNVATPKEAVVVDSAKNDCKVQLKSDPTSLDTPVKTNTENNTPKLSTNTSVSEMKLDLVEFHKLRGSKKGRAKLQKRSEENDKLSTTPGLTPSTPTRKRGRPRKYPPPSPPIKSSNKPRGRPPKCPRLISENGLDESEPGLDLPDVTEDTELVTTVKDKVVTPVKDKVVTPVKDKVVTTVKDKVVTPVKDKVVTPVKEKVVTTVKDKVVTTVKDKVVTTVKDKVNSSTSKTDSITSEVKNNDNNQSKIEKKMSVAENLKQSVGANSDPVEEPTPQVNEESSCSSAKCETSSKSSGETEEAIKTIQGNENSVEAKPKTEEEDEEYTCSACNVRFTSIYEHIKQFHNGEEVVVEVPEEEIKEDLKAYQNENDNKIELDPVASSSIVTEVNGTENIKNVPKLDNVDCRVKNSPITTNKVKQEIIAMNNIDCASNKNSFSASVNKAKQLQAGKWVHSMCKKKVYYQFVNDHKKLAKLFSEVKINTNIHPEFKLPIKELFENPKINVVEITNKPNSPFFTHRTVDFEKPIPMYVVERKASEDADILGGIASYIIANPTTKSDIDIPADSRVVAVMKVFVASDRELTLENIVFKDKPGIEHMIPVLEDVTQPELPLLIGAKILKWQCTKCLTTTWKFPLTRDSHLCNACPVCHKPFTSGVSLRKHVLVHKKDGSRFCEECQTSFANITVLQKHLELHDSHALCPLCKLFVPKDLYKQHQLLHDKSPHEQFPCSVCHKVFGSKEQMKTHETRLCAKLVAKYNCSACDKKFFSLTALSYHTRDHKNVIIKYPCRFCSKTFLRSKEQCPRKAGKRKPSGYIQKMWHERIHTRERPVTCSACPKRFRSLCHQQSHARQAHVNSSHRDVPCYMCSVCDKVFSSAAVLATHTSQHHIPS